MLVCPGEERGALCASQIYIIIIKGLSLLQSIPPTTANKQTQSPKKRVSMARKLLGHKYIITNNMMNNNIVKILSL